MNPPSIKLLEPAELEAAVVLFHGQLQEHEIAAGAEDLRTVIGTVLSRPESGFILLARVDARPVGVAYVATLLSLEHRGPIGWLEELYVLPEYRACGIGSALVAEVLVRAGQLGWKGVELELMAGHDRASRLYLRRGFQPLARHRFCRLLSERI